MVEMTPDTPVIGELNTTENTISIDEQMIGWFGGRCDGTTLRIPPMPVGDGMCVFQCDRGCDSQFARQLQVNDTISNNEYYRSVHSAAMCSVDIPDQLCNVNRPRQ